jgi:CPA2 family monovalent cation:H+ antiporter-2
MLLLGFSVGRALGWTVLESVFTGAIIAISSTTIIAKAFDEQGARGRVRDFVVGVLVVEDLIAIVLLAGLTAITSKEGPSPKALVASVARLGAFLAVVLGVGRLVVPRMIRAATRLNRPETTLVASIGVCFAMALLVLKLGYSVALGAFIAGSLTAESGEESRIEPLINPVRDMFAAIFFVSVGMILEPALVLRHWAAILVLTLVVISGKIATVTIGACVAGKGLGSAVRAGMSLAQIGELSYLIAGLGLATHATRPFLYPVAVSVSLVTTLTTPWLIRASGPVGAWIDARVGPSFPRRLGRRPT